MSGASTVTTTRPGEQPSQKAYDLWAGFYDHTFGAITIRRQVRALKHLHLRPGDRVLDLGVGTGLLLPYYPRHVTVVGVDLNRPMLQQAQQRRDAHRLEHCHLVCADALEPPLAPASFDHIVLMHMISVVPQPHRVLRWCGQLLRPGGRILIMNHFLSHNPVVACAERLLNPICVHLGWRSDLRLPDLVDGTDLRMEYCFRPSLVDPFRVVVLTHARPAEAGSPASPPSLTLPAHLLPTAG